VAITFILAFNIGQKESVRKFVQKGSETSLIDSVRQNAFERSLSYFNDKPILGYGFGLSWNVKASDIDAVLRTGRMSMFVGEFGNSTIAILIGGGLLLLICYYGHYFWEFQ
jgi:O-antigen ligase